MPLSRILMIQNIQCLRRGWRDSLNELLASAQRDILICSPYITQEGVRVIEENISRDFQQGGCCTVLTNLTPTNILQGATDPRALQHLANRIPTFTLRHLPRLHAKIYIADVNSAIVTSANLTYGGVEANYEYGIRLSDEETVTQIREDVTGYGELGARLSNEELSNYVEVSDQVRTAFQREQRSVTGSARAEFEQLLHKAENELIAIRVSGVSRTQVFERTIEYLLNRHGSMTTPALHSRIAAIHPDLCDETIDRVIDGKHFGKKWKHVVRSAQAHLKARRRIKLANKLWKTC